MLMSAFPDATRYVTFVIFVMLKMMSKVYDLLRATFGTFMICGNLHFVMLRYVNVLLCYFVAASSYQGHLKV
jgi:hypothetical protein